MAFLRGFAPFLDYRYWFNLYPVPLGPSLVGGIFAFFGWFIIAMIIFRLVAHGLKKRDPLKAAIFLRTSALLGTTGILGLLFLFFAYEEVPLLRMRFWFLFLFVMFAAWVVRIALYIVRDYPVLRDERLERQRLRKYLPKAG